MATTKYEFTIPQNTLGLTADRVIVSDRNLGRQATFDLLTAKFGDGYEQRAIDGINSKKEVFSLSFKNRDYKEANLIAAFFDSKRGLNFNLTITNTKDVESTNPTDIHETIKVACDGYNLTYITDTVASISTQLRRVYEP